jgi:hypothetical protein
MPLDKGTEQPSEVVKEFHKADSAPSLRDTETDRNLGESGECVLQVRLRDGKTLQGRFEPNDKCVQPFSLFVCSFTSFHFFHSFVPS